MPRSLALWLCIGFVLFLFIVDRQSKGGGSFARWLVLAYVAMISSRAVSLWFDLGVSITSPDDYLEGSPVDRNIFIGFLIAGVFILMRRRVNWEGILKNNRWIFVFFLFAGVSVLWSDYSLVAFKRWVKAVGLFVMVLVVLTEDDPVEALRWVFRKNALLLIPFSVLLGKYYPEYGRTYSYSGSPQFTGVTGNKNMLGNLCYISGVYFVWDLLALKRGAFLENRRAALIDFGMLLTILYLFHKVNSATSLVCFLLGAALLIFMEAPSIKENIGRLGVYLIMGLMLFGVLEVFFGLTEAVVSGLGRDMTFTGRVDVWHKVLSMAENSVIGSGYESFWLGNRAKQMWEIYTWGINQAHNGYIEIYLNLGMIGLVLLAVLMLTSYKNISSRIMSDHTMGSLRMAFFLTLILYNFSEATFKIGLAWFVFFLSCMDYKAKPVRQNRSMLKVVRKVPGRSLSAAGSRG